MTVTNLPQLKQQIDHRVFNLANQVILRWKLPSIPGFKDDDTFDASNQTLTDIELNQLIKEIEEKKSPTTAKTTWNWSKKL